MDKWVLSNCCDWHQNTKGLLDYQYYVSIIKTAIYHNFEMLYNYRYQENMIIRKLRTWSRSDKIGVKFQARVSKELFGLIEDIELMELPLQGRKFTWNNAVSAAKLDRFLFTIDWD